MFAQNNNMQTDIRQIKGKQIAETCRIVKTNKGWEVPSQSGHGKYLVYYAESLLSKPKCTCPDHEIRNCKCKHIWAVEYIATKVVDSYGNASETPNGVVIWRRMYHYYMLNRDEFLEHYHSEVMQKVPSI